MGETHNVGGTGPGTGQQRPKRRSGDRPRESRSGDRQAGCDEAQGKGDISTKVAHPHRRQSNHAEADAASERRDENPESGASGIEHRARERLTQGEKDAGAEQGGCDADDHAPHGTFSKDEPNPVHDIPEWQFPVQPATGHPVFAHLGTRDRNRCDQRCREDERGRIHHKGKAGIRSECAQNIGQFGDPGEDRKGCRPDRERPVHRNQAQAVRPNQHLLRYEVRDAGFARRPPEQRKHLHGEGDEKQLRERTDEHQRHDEQRPAGVAHDHGDLAVEAVCEHAGSGTEESRQHPGGQRNEDARHSADRIGESDRREEGDPVAEARRETGPPETRERTVTHQAEYARGGVPLPFHASTILGPVARTITIDARHRWPDQRPGNHHYLDFPPCYLIFIAAVSKPLIIVESPAKARTISGFLGSGYAVESSIGHIRDLPSKASEIPKKYREESWARLGVNVEKDFAPLYIVPAAKREQVRKLKDALARADEVYLATDEDREGESIAWHLLQVLKPKVPVKRMVFHEITKRAITEALEHPRELDTRLVDAQEARRILDRLFGYEVSPVLWRKVQPKLSAGRVQSVAVRIVVERERQRIAFRSASYWDLLGTFQPPEGVSFTAPLTMLDGRPVASGKDFDAQANLTNPGALVLDEAASRTLADALEDTEAIVRSVESKPYRRSPYAPFRTSTLQQEAGRKLRFSASRTMRAAQRLYENGYITYMRTD
ncbi:MAG TPA: hypothetical protein ENH00_07275, partial [Actinobacteria bacterium]|nr:hypothetical protein [Actinomycetota bacterium]